MGHPSGYDDGSIAEQVARASDFLLIHFNGTSLDAIPGLITALKRFGKPIVCNEDAKVGAQGAKAAELCVAGGASWGSDGGRDKSAFPLHIQGSGGRRGRLCEVERTNITVTYRRSSRRLMARYSA